MASLHVIVEATSGTGKRIPNASVRISGGIPPTFSGLPLGCAGYPGFFDVTVQTDARGVADYNLGDACGINGLGTPVNLHVEVTTPKNARASASWTFVLVPAGDWTTTVTVTTDEGSAAGDAADAASKFWKDYGPWVALGAVAVGAYIVYRLVKKGTE